MAILSGILDLPGWLRYRNESGFCGAIIRALRGEQQIEIAAPEPYDPEKQGSIWLLRPSDTDETVANVFGKALVKLSFYGVHYDEEGEHFVCHLVVANSVCHTLIVPDMHWLSWECREHLMEQMIEAGPCSKPT